MLASDTKLHDVKTICEAAGHPPGNLGCTVNAVATGARRAGWTARHEPRTTGIRVAEATARPHGVLWIAYNAEPGNIFWSGFTKKLLPK